MTTMEEPKTETNTNIKHSRKDKIHHILKNQFSITYSIDIDNHDNHKLYKTELTELKHILKWFRTNKKIMIELKFANEWKRHYLPKIKNILYK